ncbi:GLUCOSAMINE 6-PHOSPHATE N-ACETYLTRANSFERASE [Salix purpurea]|uniref:GLUCOSAMINE 6-PHOSPHATE N-ACETYLTRANSFERASE n=1 Tax=Salix purpurea TaxID=77065 RepID=A0A9Q0ZS29_SALPP|nr:GLUCOSAMINE 6-PHOSPHATE N-ACETYLTRANSFERASE [Salix purpurea]
MAAAAAAPMTIKMKACCGYGGIKAMEIRWATRKENSNEVSTKLKQRIPIFISTNPSHINPQELRDLYGSCNHSCHRFPKMDKMGKLVDPVDIKRLTIALSHSDLLVSVFCNKEDVLASDDDDCGNEREPSKGENPPVLGLGDLLQRVVPLPVVSPSTGMLVGFGRAVSDHGLTASIFDVMNTHR